MMQVRIGPTAIQPTQPRPENKYNLNPSIIGLILAREIASMFTTPAIIVLCTTSTQITTTTTTRPIAIVGLLRIIYLAIVTRSLYPTTCSRLLPIRPRPTTTATTATTETIALILTQMPLQMKKQ
jgi:hypothetical protein